MIKDKRYHFMHMSNCQKLKAKIIMKLKEFQGSLILIWMNPASYLFFQINITASLKAWTEDEKPQNSIILVLIGNTKTKNCCFKQLTKGVIVTKKWETPVHHSHSIPMIFLKAVQSTKIKNINFRKNSFKL